VRDHGAAGVGQRAAPRRHAAQEVPHPLRAPRVEVDAPDGAVRGGLARRAGRVLGHARRLARGHGHDRAREQGGSPPHDLRIEVGPGSAPLERDRLLEDDVAAVLARGHPENRDPGLRVAVVDRPEQRIRPPVPRQ